ncbi:MAG: terpene cyclase/mutase family protein [Lentisphaerae bacterium]|jgi:squalene-hopene/tetraprenyl-beta-curcumene cyclase|nr:terpene cyclase/mutase family protein [Lentisphaerota bacterium]MBT4819120.1 terpene cyclase/mutase family protein [Lentisphaerota bacterium]MBT5606657.1 terpene cyclase/mutase family protein [Lentisphaerota bacterium]MBT7057172.1 terpene cyclase/mutase family protein [Lentisphaerota bacterium]MBT7847063.1 terpene cyclase/mutase family protein [Lentisphaerota bacterium]
MQTKRPFTGIIERLAVAITVTGALFSTAQPTPSLAVPQIPETLVLESRAAVERGIGFMMDKQMSSGAWLHSPAITALACMALHAGEAPKYGVARELSVEKGRRFVLSNARKDGAICSEDRSYVNYSTAICLTALAVLANPKDIEVMRKARGFLIGSQLDEDHDEHPTEKGDAFYGGIGYGSGGPTRPDLSNTQWALEALYLTDFLAREPFSKDPAEAKAADLAWDKARQFLSAVQNLEQTKSGAWLVTETKDGGFVYRPDQSKASDKQGQVETLRSYGTMTYAGLKSMLYAKLEHDDPRVKAAMEWARKHYTLDENPGMGPEGHFYYLHTFAKAHSALGGDAVVTPDGKQHAWRTDLVRKLVGMQKGDGQWTNDASGRWQESMPELVTPYALICLEIALGDHLKAK